MTLSQIILNACKLVSRNNAEWRDFANERAQNRAEFIWDFHDWEDSLILGTKTVEIGATDIRLAAEVETVSKVKWDYAGNLRHLPLNRLFEYDAGIFTANGTPVSWSKLAKDDDGVRGIRVWPAPEEAKVLLYVAKTKFTELEDNEPLPLTAMNNCLESFIVADLWERARQHGKAQSKYQEALAMLKVMKDNEINQGALELEILPDGSMSGATHEWDY